MTPANIPWPPAFATAATSSAVPTVPIGASCSGSSQPTSSVKRVAGTAALTELRAADRVVHGEGPLGAPLVVELEAGAGLHLPLACAGEDLLPVLRGVVAPERVRGRPGAAVRPAKTHEASHHLARRVGGAPLQLPRVHGRVHPPGGVGLELRDAVPLALVRGRGGLGRGFPPPIFLHQTQRRAGRVHRDPAAAPNLFALLRLRLAASEDGQNEENGEPSLRPAHLSSVPRRLDR